ncbi:MAG: hypothetical protein AAGB04_32000 [Pseudomonadota bacterium]
MKIYFKYFLLVSFAIVVGCTARTHEAVKRNFPQSIFLEEFLFFKTDYFRCTFAEVKTSEDSYIQNELIEDSSSNLEDLKNRKIEDAFSKYIFPDGGFAAFESRSLAEVAGDIESSGSSSLGYNVGEEIFSGKSCLRSLIDAGKSNQRKRYVDAIGRDDGIVIIGKNYRHTTIIFFPDENLAYYFGP